MKHTRISSPTDFSELCEQLSKFLPNTVVGIEGFMNSGKSYLSDAISDSLGCQVIHTDDYVTPGDESLPYVERLNYSQLKSLLSNTTENSSIILVDGICLRQVLARAQIIPDLFIYVKRMASNGIWHDGLHLEDYEADEQNITEEPGKSDLSYHAIERPHERAEVMFHRLEQLGTL